MKPKAWKQLYPTREAELQRIENIMSTESTIMDGSFGTVPHKTVQCDSCGRDIAPGEKIHFHPHGVECMSCLDQRFSWFYVDRRPHIFYGILVGIGLVGILVGGLLALFKLLGS